MTTLDFEPFELLVTGNAAAGYSALIVESPAGEGRSALALDPQDVELQDAVVACLERNTDAPFLQDLGSVLFDELFQGQVEQLFRSSLAIVRHQNRGLRVRLRLEPPELAALPWEFLYDRIEEHFVATLPDAALVRYVPVRLPARPTTVAPPLRILIAVAAPDGLPPIDIDTEIAVVTEALSEWCEQGRVETVIATHATYQQVTGLIRDCRPHIVHFIGHGLFHDDAPYLAFEDHEGQLDLVDAARSQALFDGAADTRLALLSACRSATQSSTDSLAGLGPRLLGRRLSAVVAMQFPIAVEAAQVFARDFYRNLVAGRPVDAAVNEARRGMFLAVNGAMPDWATPVLFLRAKDGRLFALERPEANELAIPAPPAPVKPPVIPEFLGREEELAGYGTSLHEHGIAVIAGMAGMGKSSLAAELATRWGYPSKTFWHTFHLDEGVETIIWKLAGFLAWHGRDDLWKMLQSTALTGGTPPPPDVLFDYLMQLIRGQEYLICLDDFQRVDDDPLLDRLTERLRPLLRAGEIRVILTSRRIPDFVQIEVAPLSGLTLADTVRLLEARRIDLSEGMLEELYHRTEGNAELLTLAIEALQNAADPARMLSKLVEAGNVERFLLSEVDKELSDENRQVMNGVAALLGYPGTRDVIEEMLGGKSTRRQLSYLVNRYLLHRYDEEQITEYGQHAIVQAFYYDLLSRDQRQEMHRQAAVYYQETEKDLLRAALHYERASQCEPAVELVLADFQALLNRGASRPLLRLLERLQRCATSDAARCRLQLALGNLYKFVGLTTEADRVLQEILDVVTTEDRDDPVRAQAYLALATVRLEADPAESLGYAEQAETLTSDQRLQLDIAVLRGEALKLLGRYHEAMAQFSLVIEQTQEEHPFLHVQGRMNQIAIHYHMGDYEEACRIGTQALQLSLLHEMPVNTLQILSNLALAEYEVGAWDLAVAHFDEAKTIAASLGAQEMAMVVALNLAMILISQGKTATAQRELDRVRVSAMERGSRLDQLHAEALLATLAVQTGDLERAAGYNRQAEELARALDNPHQLQYVQLNHSTIARLRGHWEDAMQHAIAAIGTAQAIHDEIAAAIGHRMLGEACLDAADLGQAETALRTSLELLPATSEYERALTILSLAKLYAAERNRDEACHLLCEADTVFQSLGAEPALKAARGLQEEYCERTFNDL